MPPDSPSSTDGAGRERRDCSCGAVDVPGASHLLWCQSAEGHDDLVRAVIDVLPTFGDGDREWAMAESVIWAYPELRDVLAVLEPDLPASLAAVAVEDGGQDKDLDYGQPPAAGACGPEALPDYLRADAPPAGVCSICLRKTWDAGEVGRPCGMPQPDGTRCYGYFYGWLEPEAAGTEAAEPPHSQKERT